MTTVTAGLIDRGLDDYMLETAMLKVWSTERLWTIVNDAFQIHGGAAYFTDRPLERMLRDHRINQIGEGANEVLMSFMALVGMREPGLRMKEVADSVKRPWSARGFLGRFLADSVSMRFNAPPVPVRSAELKPAARRLGKLIGRLGAAVQTTLVRYREEIVERQLVQERIAWVAMELFATACALSRWDDEFARNERRHDAVARFFVADSLRRAESSLRDLSANDDRLLRKAASDLSAAFRAKYPGIRRPAASSGSSLLRSHAEGAVQSQDAAVEHVVLEDVAHHRRKFIGLAEPVWKRNLVDQRLTHLFRSGLHHCGIEHAGSDGNDSDAVLSQFTGQRQRERSDAAFRRRIRSLADLTLEGGDGRSHHHDAAEAIFLGFASCDCFGRQPHRVERASQVDVDDAAKVLKRRDAFASQQAFGVKYAGAGDSAAERSETFFAGRDGGSQIGFAGDVGAGEQHVIREFVKRAAAWWRDVGNDDRGASPCQRVSTHAAPSPELPPVTRMVDAAICMAMWVGRG